MDEENIQASKFDGKYFKLEYRIERKLLFKNRNIYFHRHFLPPKCFIEILLR